MRMSDAALCRHLRPSDTTATEHHLVTTRILKVSHLAAGAARREPAFFSCSLVTTRVCYYSYVLLSHMAAGAARREPAFFSCSLG
jgi:hypothetical protein